MYFGLELWFGRLKYLREREEDDNRGQTNGITTDGLGASHMSVIIAIDASGWIEYIWTPDTMWASSYAIVAVPR